MKYKGVPDSATGMGLIKSGGEPKPAFAAFKKIINENGIIRLSGVSEIMTEKKVTTYKPDLFGLYTATLDGENMKLIISNPNLEMTHARVSPDKEWITFTRYNQKGLDGLAMEYDYAYTEIMIARLDGSGLESVIPPKKGIIAANSSWTPDGKSLLYVSNDNPDKIPRICKIDLTTRKINRVPTPEHLAVADPHQVGNRIVFPVAGDGLNSTWIMDADGKNAKQLTRPVIPEPKTKKKYIYNLGDCDPKLSPDASKVTVIRYFGGTNWHIILVDVETGKEKNLSVKNTCDAVADWSSDGKLLLFWHVNLQDFTKIGLYTMLPDGTKRRMIPLPRGYFYRHANYFPGEGSSEKTRIIFSGKKDPGML